MALVDYESDSEDATSPTGSPSRKKPRTGSGSGSNSTHALRTLNDTATTSTSTASLPPLPTSFHDLYASTVRTTTYDDPSLHQGRTRQNPHVHGHWPSHIYIEWHPPPSVHASLSAQLARLQSQAKSETGADVTSFLTSGLAAPLPLHISLSRPIVLSSETKEAFLRDVQTAVAADVPVFELRGHTVEWHRTSESGRSFLVLRVRSLGAADEDGTPDRNPNPELTSLLKQCNAVVEKYGQPGLYQWVEEEGEKERRKGGVGTAFHVSIAWSFAEPTEELVSLTRRVFDHDVGSRTGVQQVRVPVEGVKVKIGNVVTHVPLPKPGRRGGTEGRRNLLGL